MSVIDVDVEQPLPAVVEHGARSNEAEFVVHAGVPQKVHISGFRSVFSCSSKEDMERATCQFGSSEPVGCSSNAVQGILECTVPSTVTTSSSQFCVDALTVKAKVANFETPTLFIPHGAHSREKQASSIDEEHASENGLHPRLLRAIQRDRWRTAPSPAYTLLQQCFAEAVGTMLIVIFGVGSVCNAVLTEYNQGLWQIAVIWGVGVSLAVVATASISGAHLNPAVSLAFALFRPADFPFRKLLPYWAAQYLGGVIGGAFNLMVYGNLFASYESARGTVRGEAKSVVTASAFGEYFPNPGYTKYVPEADVTPAFALLVEAWGTALLMFVILAVTDPRQKIIRQKELVPLYIGFTVATLITLYAPLTQAGWNPARDFGPRIVAALAGWGRIAIPGPRNGFWVYILGPKIGAPIGALAYDLLLNPGLGHTD